MTKIKIKYEEEKTIQRQTDYRMIYIYNVQYAIKRKNEDYYINKIYGFGDFFGSRHGK